MQSKKNPKANLEKYSAVFSLLGLVLSLFITLIFIEHKTYAAKIPDASIPFTIPLDESATMVNLEIKEKKAPKIETPKDEIEPIKKPEKLKKTIDPTTFKKEKNDVDIIEKIMVNKDETVADTDIKDIKYENIPEEAGIETVPYISVDNVPVFPGCEKYIYDKKKSKKCFNKNMSKFFGRNFDLGLASDLNLSGIQKINCQFIIDSNGEISPDIYTSKTHPKLAEEIKSVIKKLPKMIPAKQNGNPVNLIYKLPVKFYVE